jgi:hypothetical protein
VQQQSGLLRRLVAPKSDEGGNEMKADIAQDLQWLADFIADVAGMWTRSRPLARPSRAFTFGRMEFPLLPIAFPASRLVAFTTSKPFAGGLHRSRSVGLTAFAVGKSFSPFPKWLKCRDGVFPVRG